MKRKSEQDKKDLWPDIWFGPVNLWVLPPAEFFYRSQNDLNSYQPRNEKHNVPLVKQS